ncbi:MAG: alkaline phosphatase family protein [Archangium sp.]
MSRWFVSALLLVSAVAFAKPPKLVVFISVDSFGTDVLQRHRSRFKGGFSKLLNEGAVFPVARYETLECVTAIGHTTMVTGAYANRHGIVGNRHFNRATGKIEPSYVDLAHPVLEAPMGNDDSSPANLLTETISDRLRQATFAKGKSIAIAGKGRSAVAMAGRLGEAWWFHEGVGKFVTGTYYRKEFPDWVKAFNDKKLPDGYHSKRWELLGAAKEYQGEDERPFESDWYGMSKIFPHPLTGGLPSPGAQSYSALASSPFMSELEVEFVKAAIDGEQLGKDDVTDLLSVSFSAVDRTYHLYGPTSWEMQDHVLRLDKMINDVIAAAEKAAGKGNVVIVLTGDHGGANIPEEWASIGVEGVRVFPQNLQKSVNEELEKKFGVPGLVAAIEETDVYLDWKAIEAKKLDVVAVRRALAAWLSKQPDIHIAVSRDDLNGVRDLQREFLHAYHSDRSGDVLMVMKPFRVLEFEKAGTSHGAPWSYDADVPVIFYGKGVKSGQYGNDAHPIDIAPTLAALMELSPPASSEGRVLFEAVQLSK